MLVQLGITVLIKLRCFHAKKMQGISWLVNEVPTRKMIPLLTEPGRPVTAWTIREGQGQQTPLCRPRFQNNVCSSGRSCELYVGGGKDSSMFLFIILLQWKTLIWLMEQPSRKPICLNPSPGRDDSGKARKAPKSEKEGPAPSKLPPHISGGCIIGLR